jgi:hypothetical protein
MVSINIVVTPTSITVFLFACNQIRTNENGGYIRRLHEHVFDSAANAWTCQSILEFPESNAMNHTVPLDEALANLRNGIDTWLAFAAGAATKS